MNTPVDRTPIPPEADRWNWGAFLLSWIWGVGNQVWIALLALIPLVGFVMMIVLGARGSRMAWEAGNWTDVEAFRKHQRMWAWIGAGVWGGTIVLVTLSVLGIGAMMKSNDAYRIGMAALNDSPEIAEAFGHPVEAGWLVSGSIKTSGGSGEADLTIPISGPRASGDAVVKARKIVGEWELISVIARPDGGDLIYVVPR